jgi:flagellar hook-length control protein FliK
METGLDPRAMKPQSDVRTEDLRTALLELGAAAGALKSAMAQEKNALTETTENSSPMMMAPTLKQPESIKVMEATPNLSANAEQMLAALAAGSKAQDMYGKSGNGSSSFGSTGKEPMSEEKSGLAKAQGANADFVMPNMMPAKEFGSPQVGATAMGGAAAAAGATRPGAEADAQSNVQALIKQAQYMIKKGGGEASVKMNPEGMGQVHLRIMVSEGKVNVEFKTETAEAKKMLESNIGDLKNSLSIHRLAVDHVKVDVGNQLANSSDHKPGQEQQQFKQDPQREQARQFFNQFHEDNSARREGYYDTKGAKAYSRSKPVEALRPGDDAQSVQTRRDLGTGRGSGLDLVA